MPAITTALLQKKFHGRAAYNPKAGDLTLTYDFKDKNELKDFALNGAKPKVAKGFLTTEPADHIKHVVKFESVTITGVILIPNLNGEHLQTSEGVVLYGGGSVVVKGQGSQLDLGGVEKERLTPFQLTVTGDRVLLNMRNKKGGLPRKVPTAGYVELLGGTGGNSFARLTLSGQVDPEWAKEFFARRSEPPSVNPVGSPRSAYNGVGRPPLGVFFQGRKDIAR
jgi:hypothetical protein